MELTDLDAHDKRIYMYLHNIMYTYTFGRWSRGGGIDPANAR